MRASLALDTGAKICYFSPPMTPEQMKLRLQENYPDGTVEVFDLTGTQDHYEVYVESGAFSGKTRIQQHQHVMACFGPELKTGEVHALSIKTKIK
jgi:stress-induced morphogen